MSITQMTETKVFLYSTRGRVAALKAPTSHQLAVYFARAFYNNPAGSPPVADVGVMRLLSSSTCKLWSWDNATYVALTMPVAAATKIVDADAVTGSPNFGFVVQAKRQFGMIGVNCSTAAAATYFAQYWDGSAWQTLTQIEAINFASTGVKYLIFLPPPAWVVGGDGALDQNLYSIRVKSTAGAATDISIDDLWVASFLEYYQDLADNQSVALRYFADKPLLLDADEGIIPYFKTATTENGITIAYSTV